MTATVETRPGERAGLITALTRGFCGRCPHCGEGKVFGRYLKVRPACESCGLELGHHRADDLPPYIVIFLVGHVVGYFLLETEMNYDLPLWFQLTFWPIVTLLGCLGLLQPVKGAVVGLQYALGMHGFAKLPLARTSDVPQSGGHADPETQRGPADGRAAERTPGFGPA
ncbi:DUF983 domain-containing protein [Methylobacterium flocculans]|uniref:DUF983 domain-containing protein n=1 Tax=Methylobacterium flocculans TaxID=2984843 RepID=UPI0021F29C5C|nr:DUF983 domain-containing protein [Methylobacterium sp. FF17]